MVINAATAVVDPENTLCTHSKCLDNLKRSIFGRNSNNCPESWWVLAIFSHKNAKKWQEMNIPAEYEKVVHCRPNIYI